MRSRAINRLSPTLGSGLIQINAAARLPPRVVHGIKTDFQHRGCRDRHHRSQRGCARRRPVVRLVNAAGRRSRSLATA